MPVFLNFFFFARRHPSALIYMCGRPPVVDAITYEKKLLYFYTAHFCTIILYFNLIVYVIIL
jgi:hypothetical protein